LLAIFALACVLVSLGYPGMEREVASACSLPGLSFVAGAKMEAHKAQSAKVMGGGRKSHFLSQFDHA